MEVTNIFMERDKVRIYSIQREQALAERHNAPEIKISYATWRATLTEPGWNIIHLN